MLLVFYPSMQGNSDAEKLIKGDSGNPRTVLTSTEDLNLTNSTLILVLYNDKNYYLVEENISVPIHPKSYIIPDTEIKMVSFK